LAARRGQGTRVADGLTAVGKAARESSHESAAPKEQPPPESLRQKDRARLTVWKASSFA